MIKENKWQLRTTAKEDSCFICYKLTNSCLVHASTNPPIDWFYTCLNHLNDPGFGTLINLNKEEGKEKSPKQSKTDIGKTTSKKEETDKNETNKSEINKDETNKDEMKKDVKEKEEIKDVKGKEKEKEEEEGESKTETKKLIGYKEYELHRDILFLRNNHLKRKLQAKRDAELMKQFPKVPKGFP
ncbi:hypothetical protein K502DRAFT_323725 [Neoconidiobolus thromboides FSU 785]|nr:hypothetical protein K502DRAFT_323725 [Neoconidiobolus thromboides FSU 785]